jgi:hypothetical protein
MSRSTDNTSRTCLACNAVGKAIRMSHECGRVIVVDAILDVRILCIADNDSKLLLLFVVASPW